MSQGSARTEPAERVEKSHDGAGPVPAARCTRCGGRLSAAGLGGICPRCLMACALTGVPDLEPCAEDDTRPTGGEAGAIEREPAATPPTAGASVPTAFTPQPTAGKLPPSFGRYTLLRRLGSGAMGEVYLAFDSQMNRQVAVKTPHFERTADPTAIERFRREARLAAALSHPNICSVYDVGEVDGVFFFTMAYVDGVPLTRWIESPETRSVREVVELVLRMAQAMAHAHRHNIVHRDLKPANVMIDRRDEPIIMDFGLARHATFDSRLTQSNAVVGTPAYLAPELIGGAADSPASDVYALGVVLFELLTKRLPFSGPLGELLAQITRDPPPAPSRFHAGVPRRLDAICLRALAKEPTDRFATMDDFAAALSRFLRRSPSGALQVWISPARERLRSSRTTRYAICGMAGVVLALSVVLAGVLVRDAILAPAPSQVGLSSDPPTASGRSRAIADGQSASATPDASPDATPDNRSPADSAQPADVPTELPGSLSENAREHVVDGPQPRKDVAQPTLPGAKPDATALRTPPALLVERPRLTDEPSTLDKPTDAPRSPLSLTELVSNEMRRLDARRRELVRQMAAVNDRLTHDIPELKLKLTGDLAGSRRLGEEAVFELQQIETRMGQLNLQRTGATAGLRNSLDQELRGLVQNRERVAQRARGLDAEIRGKTVELGQVEKDAAQLHQTAQQLLAESAQLVELAFWNADPAGSLDRQVYQAIADDCAEWLRDSGSPVEVLALRAVALANAGKADEGLREAQRALAQQPKSPAALSASGYGKLVKGQTSDAIADFNRALRLHPRSSQAAFFRGLAHRRRGNHAAAAEDFATALNGAPQSPWSKAQWALQQAGIAADTKVGEEDRRGDENRGKPPQDLRRAVDLARQACDATGRQSWFCLEALAAVLAVTGDWNEAIACEESALTMAPPENRAACQKRLDAYRGNRHFSF